MVELAVTTPAVQPRRRYSRIILNLPPELAQRIRDLAARERRPISTQIQVLVEQALKERVAA